MDIERIKKEYANKYHSETEIENMFKNGFNNSMLLGCIYKNEYYNKYTNLIKYNKRDFLMNLFKKNKINNINTIDLSKENLEKILLTKNIKREFFKKIFIFFFNKKVYLKYYKKEKETMLRNFKHFSEMSFEELNNNIEVIKKEFENLNLKYKEKYEKEYEKLLKIINPIYIEKEYWVARRKKRNIKAFLGPTNSGKTHKAISILKKAKTGIYLAPLRLLAREIYDDLISSGIKTSLITGEEKIIDPEATHVCSTIEMVDINEKYDMAVIDEIQFLSDNQRGSAWSRALIGMVSKEIIVVGSKNAEYLIKEIVNRCNDKLKISYFKRLSALKIEENILRINNLKKGDAVIAFSRDDVHEIKKILTKKGFSVSLIYGALPPEVRLAESKRFNEGETDILVATDAIGYGLNLNIERVVFTYLEKYNGSGMERITQSLFNQIAGRAGRFGKIKNGKVAHCADFGYKKEYLYRNWGYRKENIDEHEFLTKRHNIFLELSNKINDELIELETAFYFPEYETLKKISEETNSEKSLFSTLSNYNKIFKNKNPIFSFQFLDKEEIITLLDKTNISFYEKYNLMFAPVNKHNLTFFIRNLAIITSGKKKIKLYDTFYERESLIGKEILASELLLYMWLSQKFPEIESDYELIQKKYINNSYEIVYILEKKIEYSIFE